MAAIVYITIALVIVVMGCCIFAGLFGDKASS